MKCVYKLEHKREHYFAYDNVSLEDLIFDNEVEAQDFLDTYEQNDNFDIVYIDEWGFANKL